MKRAISIIIPVYNAEKFIYKAVLSILKQSFSDYEVILVDDGSLDHSGEICKKICMEYENMSYYYQRNQGATVARKVGVDKAIGDYVLFLDSDDLLPPDGLSMLYSFVSENVDVVIGFDDAPECIPHKDPEIFDGNDLLNRLLERRINVNVAAKLWRRDLFNEHTFMADETIRMGEDFLMNIRLSQKVRKAVLIYQAVYIYIHHESQVTHNFKYSLAYEKIFDKNLVQALQNTTYKRSSLMRARLYKLRFLMRLGQDNFVRDSFVKEICMEAMRYRLSLEDYIFIFFKGNAPICRFLLQKVAGIKRRIFKIYH